MEINKITIHKPSENLFYLADILWSFDRRIFFLAIAEALTGAMIPYLSILVPKYAIAGILDMQEEAYWIVFFVLFGAGGILLHALDALFSNRFKAHISATRNGCFGQMLTDKMFRMKYSLLEQPKIQELCFRANFLFWSDNNGMAGVFEGIRVMLAGGLTLSGLAVLLSRFRLHLLFFLAGLVIANVVLLNQARKKEDGLRESRNGLEREKEYLNQTMRDLTAGKDISLYGLTGFLTGWYRSVSQKAVKISAKIQTGYTGASLGGAALALLRDGVVYGSLLAALLRGQIRADDFLLYVGVASCFTETLVSIIDQYMDVRQFLGHADDFRKVMELEEEVWEDEGVRSSFQEIRFDQVSFRYPGSEAYALEKIDLTLRPGERIAVVGRNGAGKTTLVKLLAGLYEPDSGSITIYDGKGEVADGKNRFSFFSVIMQKIHQYPFTLLENMTFQEKGTERTAEISEAAELSGMTAEMKKLPHGADTMLRKDFDPKGVTLSGGQAQKLALARALYKDAPIVILDEPSAALDPLAEQELYERFYRMLEGKACVFISHRLSSVKFCDRILLLDQGRIAGCGSHEQLLKDCALYSELWEAQSRPYQEGKEGTGI